MANDDVTKAAENGAAADPIFAAIAERKAREKVMYRLNDKLGEAVCEACKTQGPRPSELIAWRNYCAIGGHELDDRREGFLSQPGADREQIETEYKDAKARLAAAKRAGIEWDHRAGIASLREQYERADLARLCDWLARNRQHQPARPP